MIIYQIHKHQIRAEELEIKVSDLLKPFVERKAKCEADFSAAPGMGETRPYGGYWKKKRDDKNHYWVVPSPDENLISISTT